MRSPQCRLSNGTRKDIKKHSFDRFMEVGLMDSPNSGTSKFTCKRGACRPKGGSSNEVAWHEVTQGHERHKKSTL